MHGSVDSNLPHMMLVRKLAYLGPEGSYSHKAARTLAQSIDAHVELEPHGTIAGAYHAHYDFAVLPLENTIQGVVTETLDAFFSQLTPPNSAVAKKLGGEACKARWTVVKDLDLKIDHCYVVKKGTKVEDVRWVMSHEQALGQCTRYLGEQYPANPARIPVPSTALAAKILASHVSSSDPEKETGQIEAVPTDTPTTSSSATTSPSEETGNPDWTATLAESLGITIPPGAGAAICSRDAVDGIEGLEVIAEGIQNVEDNYTRFLLLARDPTTLSIRRQTGFSHGSSGFVLLNNLSDLAMIPARHQRIAIHSRPCLDPPQKYAKMYLVEIDIRDNDDDEGEEGWADALNAAPENEDQKKERPLAKWKTLVRWIGQT